MKPKCREKDSRRRRGEAPFGRNEPVGPSQLGIAPSIVVERVASFSVLDLTPPSRLVDLPIAETCIRLTRGFNHSMAYLSSVKDDTRREGKREILRTRLQAGNGLDWAVR